MPPGHSQDTFTPLDTTFKPNLWSKLSLPAEPPPSRRLAAEENALGPALAIFGILVWLVWRICRAVRPAILFDGLHFDGPFQILDPLRRLAAGQTAGRDFPVFHGIAIPLLHYPLFRLFGGGLLGSELSRQLVSLLAYFLTVAGIFRLLAGSWRRAVMWLVLYLFAVEVPAIFGFGKFGDASYSLVELRALMPLLGLCGYAAIARRQYRVAFLGLCLGAAFVLGVDQFLAVFMALGAVIGVLAVKALLDRGGPALDIVKELAASAVIALVFASAALIAICGPSGVSPTLKYYFREMPADQFWYFGAPPVAYFSRLSDLWTTRYRIPLLIAASCIAGSLAYLLWAKKFTSRQAGVALFLCYTGCTVTPLLGVTTQAYLHNGELALTLAVALVWGSRIYGLLFSHRGATLALLGMVAVVGSANAGTYLAGLWRMDTLRRVHFSSKWQHVLDAETAILKQYETRGKRPLWNLYASEMESRRGEFLPVEDYVIHALGAERRARYAAVFRAAEPEVVVTSHPRTFLFEPWLQNETWEVYQELLTHYSVAAAVEWAVFWVRNPAGAPAAIPLPGHAAAPDPQHLIVDPPPGDGRPRLGTVTVTYTVESPSRTGRYLLAGDSPARAIPVSLPPYLHTWKFPVIADAAPVKFSASTSGLFAHGEARITAASVEWWPAVIPVYLFDNRVEPFVPDLHRSEAPNAARHWELSQLIRLRP